MSNSKKFQTLHAHTKVSDGLLNHKEVLDLCLEKNIGVVAFTDHDAVPDQKTYKLLARSKDHHTKWIIGIEISSGWPLNLGGGPTSGLHIVGLFVNPFDKALVEHCNKAQEARVVRMQKMVSNLNKLGFKITEHDCLNASGGESVGRPHIVIALKYYPENKRIMENLRLKMEKDAEHDKTLADKYHEMMIRGEAQYPYMLFLGDDAYINGIYVDYQYYSDFDKSVKLIRNASGLAILAHWVSCRYKMTESYLDKVFADNRLDGAETVYGLWNYKGGKWPNQEAELEIIKKLVKKHKKLQSGGADAHTTEDFEQFSKEIWFSKRTIGMVERIMKSTKIETKWSSF